MKWKFVIDYSNDDMTKSEVRKLALKAAHNGTVSGDEIFFSTLDDAFSFRMNAGHIVGKVEKIKA